MGTKITYKSDLEQKEIQELNVFDLFYYDSDTYMVISRLGYKESFEEYFYSKVMAISVGPDGEIYSFEPNTKVKPVESELIIKN